MATAGTHTSRVETTDGITGREVSSISNMLMTGVEM